MRSVKFAPLYRLQLLGVVGGDTARIKLYKRVGKDKEISKEVYIKQGKMIQAVIKKWNAKRTRIYKKYWKPGWKLLIVSATKEHKIVKTQREREYDKDGRFIGYRNKKIVFTRYLPAIGYIDEKGARILKYQEKEKIVKKEPEDPKKREKTKNTQKK